jgi:hypothetical protein
MKTLTINNGNQILVLNKFEGLPRYMIRIYNEKGIAVFDLTISAVDKIKEFLKEDKDETH